MKTKKYTFKSYFSDYATATIELSKKQFDIQLKQLKKEVVYSKYNNDDSMWIEYKTEQKDYEEMTTETHTFQNGYVVYVLSQYTCKDGYCFRSNAGGKRKDD